MEKSAEWHSHCLYYPMTMPPPSTELVESSYYRELNPELMDLFGRGTVRQQCLPADCMLNVLFIMSELW